MSVTLKSIREHIAILMCYLVPLAPSAEAVYSTAFMQVPEQTISEAFDYGADAEDLFRHFFLETCQLDLSGIANRVISFAAESELSPGQDGPFRIWELTVATVEEGAVESEELDAQTDGWIELDPDSDTSDPLPIDGTFVSRGSVSSESFFVDSEDPQVGELEVRFEAAFSFPDGDFGLTWVALLTHIEIPSIPLEGEGIERTAFITTIQPIALLLPSHDAEGFAAWLIDEVTSEIPSGSIGSADSGSKVTDSAQGTNTQGSCADLRREEVNRCEQDLRARRTVCASDLAWGIGACIAGALSIGAGATIVKRIVTGEPLTRRVLLRFLRSLGRNAFFWIGVALLAACIFRSIFKWRGCVRDAQDMFDQCMFDAHALYAECARERGEPIQPGPQLLRNRP